MKRVFLSALAAVSLSAAAPAASVSLPLKRVSFYTASAAETDSTPSLGYCRQAYTGRPEVDWRLPKNAIGVSAALMQLYPCGTKVRVTTASGRVFNGVVADRMGNKYASVYAADVLVGSRQEAIRLGTGPGRIERLR